MAESLIRRDFAMFNSNFSPQIAPQFQNPAGIMDAAIPDVGGFDKVLDVKKDLYADVVVVAVVCQRGIVNVEITLDPSLKIIAWQVQPADKPRYFWPEFRDAVN